MSIQVTFLVTLLLGANGQATEPGVTINPQPVLGSGIEIMEPRPTSSTGVRGNRRMQIYPAFSNTGNPVLHTPNLYFLWYGNWNGTSPNTRSLLTSMASSMGGTPWFGIQQTYYDNSGPCSAQINYAGAASDAGYSQGTSLTSTKVMNAVYAAQTAGSLPFDPNGIFLLLSTSDVTHTGSGLAFCTQMCGYHSYFTSGTSKYVFGFIGATAKCPSSCSLQSTPNGDANADGMINIIAHESAEATTDPYLNAYTSSNGENADRCAWTFGSTYTSGNGQTANVNWGARDLLVQQNWINAGANSVCALSYSVVSLSPSAAATITASPSSSISLGSSSTPSASLTVSGTAAASITAAATISRSGSPAAAVSKSVSAAKTGTASHTAAATPSGTLPKSPSKSPSKTR